MDLYNRLLERLALGVSHLFNRPISEEQEEALATVGITAVGGKDMARKQRLRSVHPLYRPAVVGHPELLHIANESTHSTSESTGDF